MNPKVKDWLQLRNENINKYCSNCNKMHKTKCMYRDFIDFSRSKPCSKIILHKNR